MAPLCPPALSWRTDCQRVSFLGTSRANRCDPGRRSSSWLPVDPPHRSSYSYQTTEQAQRLLWELPQAPAPCWQQWGPQCECYAQGVPRASASRAPPPPSARLGGCAPALRPQPQSPGVRTGSRGLTARPEARGLRTQTRFSGAAFRGGRGTKGLGARVSAGANWVRGAGTDPSPSAGTPGPLTRSEPASPPPPPQETLQGSVPLT